MAEQQALLHANAGNADNNNNKQSELQIRPALSAKPDQAAEAAMQPLLLR